MTATKQALIDLALRVEGLDGPCRETDTRIAHAIAWRWDGWVEGDVEIETRSVDYVIDRVANSYNSIWRYLPAYTASLDAAMQLVRPEYGFQVDGYGDHWWASLSEDERFNANCKTPALALTAASLRARAVMMDDENE